jgi:RimJ/RimL family protein N-acetyltransferase
MKQICLINTKEHENPTLPSLYGEGQGERSSLVVFETKRLKIRKFVLSDLPTLHAIMKKEEVMSAWEHGFSNTETKQWLNKQLTRYRKDGYGYFAVILKETGTLIGQVGLLNTSPKYGFYPHCRKNRHGKDGGIYQDLQGKGNEAFHL